MIKKLKVNGIHSGNTIIKHKPQSEWKIQLTTAINFTSSKKDSDEIGTMRTKSDNIEIMMGSETDVIENFLNLFWKDIKKD